jgi:Asp-tRNA(Asn)/Glu-tRNA(Gln) amidotransferase A subunit family amidase
MERSGGAISFFDRCSLFRYSLLMGQEFHELSATQLVSGLQSKRWTSLELTQHYLDRISAINHEASAVPILFREEALRQAQESDLRRMAGRSLGPLDGIPMTIKDAIRMQDSLSTYGIWFFRKHRPQTDSQLIEALRKNGAFSRVRCSQNNIAIN